MMDASKQTGVPEMDWNCTKRGEHANFRRVLAWCAQEVTTRFSKAGRYASRLFFARMEGDAIAGIGTVEMLDDAGDTPGHLANMSQVVELPNVDVVVLVRQVREIATSQASELDSSPVFMFHLIGKRYEATVVWRPPGQRPADDLDIDLRLDQLYPRQRSMTHH